jgi:cytochrome c-type biogenesis protein CcmH
MMLFWTVLAAMTAAAVLAVLWPLSRQPRMVLGEAAGVAVYRDQLAEIERDRARWLLAPAEVEAARTEISRRLLNAAADKTPASVASIRRRRIASIAALIGIPAISLTLYLSYGAPEVPDAPRAARLAPPIEQQDIGMLVYRLEERLTSRPDDGQGWELIAPIYLRVGRVDDAVAAQEAAIRILGSNAARQVTLGEALLTQTPGKISADASAAFQRALEHDAKFSPALFYLGLAAEQNGDREVARKYWTQVIESAGPKDMWRIPAQRHLIELERRAR